MGRRVEVEVEAEEEGCRTPTAEECRIPEEPTVCPPAPRKQRSSTGPAQPAPAKGFFTPPDLEAFFTAHKAF